MAAQPDPSIEIDKNLFAVAARLAREKCHLQKAQIADRAGMSPRMLHRVMTGRTKATESQRERILLACNLPAMTSRFLAESDQCELIGTSAHEWLEGFVRNAITNLVLIREQSGMEVEARWAASDAALILARWQKIIDQRRAFMTDYFSGGWPDRDASRR